MSADVALGAVAEGRGQCARISEGDWTVRAAEVRYGDRDVNLSVITTCIVALGLLLTVYCIIRLGVSYRAERQRCEDATGEPEGRPLDVR
jgi:hypothetical protein